MKGYSSDKIRNVVLLGHGGCGKTTFLEAALLATKVINRLGKVEDGNTVSDYDKMEIEKKYSINTTMVPVEYNGYKYNFLDTPGFFDFAGEVQGALRGNEYGQCGHYYGGRIRRNSGGYREGMGTLQ